MLHYNRFELKKNKNTRTRTYKIVYAYIIHLKKIIVNFCKFFTCLDNFGFV